MLLTALRLSEITRALDAARVANTHRCEAVRLIGGKPTHQQPKPLKRGAVPPNGATVVTRDDGSRGYLVDVPNGTHGNVYLAIDPETGAIGCARCAGLVPEE